MDDDDLNRRLERIHQSSRGVETICCEAFGGSNLRTDSLFDGKPFYRLPHPNDDERFLPVGIFPRNFPDGVHYLQHSRGNIESWLEKYISQLGIVPLTLYYKSHNFFNEGTHYPITQEWRDNLFLFELGYTEQLGVTKDTAYFVNLDDKVIEKHSIERFKKGDYKGINLEKRSSFKFPFVEVDIFENKSKGVVEIPRLYGELFD